MKQMYLNRINSQVRFENGTGMVRVLSRIGSRNSRHSLDSILSRICLVSLILMTMGVGNAWGKTGTGSWSAKTYLYSGSGKATAEVWRYNLASSDDNVSSVTANSTSAKTATHSESTSWTNWALDYYYPKYVATTPDGYSFGGWYNTSNQQVSTSETYYPRGTGIGYGATDNNWSYEFKAKFDPVTVSSAGSADAISFNHPETKTVTLYFPVSNNADAKADFNAPTITANKVWTIKSWSLNTSTHKVEVVCEFVATSDVAKGQYVATVTLKSKADKSNTGTVTANVDLTPTLTYNNGSVDISVSDADKTTLNVANLKTAYKGADNVAGDGTITYALKTANSNVSLTSAGIFYAKATGTYTIVASATKGRYYAKTAEFTVTVGKRTPTFEWWNANGATHIYAGDVLTNVAQAKYNGNNVTGLTYNYDSSDEIRAVVDGTTIRIPSTGFTVAGTVTITVQTDETTYYKKGEDTHDYYIEPKATPVFKLDGVDLPESPVKELTLLIGKTANMTFENTDETNGQFTYPTTPTYVTYTHNSQNHTGVITGRAYGDEYIQFAQTGTTKIFGRTRQIHVFVRKHPVVLTTPMGGTWKVDSVYDGTLYSLSDTPEEGEPVQNDVTISSSNKSVVDYVNGHWKAVGAGSATLTIAQKNNDYWTGDTITTTITVEKYTPVITWNLEASYAWGSQISNPVSSTCELPFTLTSSDPTKADYVDGKIEVYNKSGNVTFTLTQEGNYKWNDASANLSYTFSCFKPDNHVPMDLKAGNYSHYKSYTTSNVSWNNSGVQCGTGGGGFNWDDKYIELHVTGVPHHLTFNYQTNNNVLGDHSGVNWFVQYKTETGNWSDKTTWSDNSGSKDFVLDPDVQYVRLCYSGNYGGLFTNVNISERHEVVAAVNKLTFTTAPVDAAAQTLSVKVNWYNVKTCAVTITGTNADFFTLQEGSETIGSSIDHFGDKTLYVKYAYPEGGTHTATLHIESEDGYTANVALEATSTKLTPSIQWKENLSPMSRGENVENPASAPVTLVYESSDSTVVDVEGNTLKPLKKGNATITASFNGTNDKKWNSVSDTYDVLVTDMKVLHINWPQTFTRLKYVAGDAGKTTANFELTATVSYFDPDTKEEIGINRTVTFTSGDDNVVQVLEGDSLHVAGLGTTTLTAHVDGVENEFIEANVVRAVKVREPSTDCDVYVLEDAHNSMLTEINSFQGVETVYELSGEPGYLTFSAWTERWYLGRIGIDPAGDMKVAQYVDGEWSEAIWSNGLEIDNDQPFGPFELDRRATKIKFYKEVGSTCYHNFSEGYVTLARYVELENIPKKTTLDLNFSTEDAKPGVPAVKTFTVNYSNITDQLVLDYEGSDKFTVLSPSSIGEECGDKGMATVQVQFLSHDVDHYEGTLTIHNANQSVTINLSADVDMHTQQIEWNPATLDLETTDDVTFDATTSGSSAGLSVRYSVTAGEDVATVDAVTGKLTIKKDGDVTVQADADGDGSTYKNADPVSKTFHISKVTPSITTIPTAATMTMPNTNLGSCGLTGGEATVEGSFAWADNTINAVLNNEGYTVEFTPKNTNWYTMATCTVVVPVNKKVNEITWDFSVTEMYCNANYTFDATATSGLDVRYETSNNQIAYVDGQNHLFIIKGGEVTITAYEDGDEETWAAATPVSKTFTIKRFTPEIITRPTASSILIGRLLDDASLTGGVVTLSGDTIDGSFAWVDYSMSMNTAGTFTKDIVFNPANSNYYEPVYDVMDVKVEKYKPTITVNTLRGSEELTYGQTVASSPLSGTLTMMDQIKTPNVEVSGSYAWADNTYVPNAGNPDSALVVFTPENEDWYLEVEFKVPVIVNKAVVLNPTAAAEVVYGQSLAYAEFESTTLNPQTGLRIDGTVSLAAYLDQNACYTEGTYELPMLFRANDENYTSDPVEGIATLTITPGIVFNGTSGTSWQEASNWGDNDKPDTGERVTINANVDIDEDVKVAGMTINAGYTVTVKSGKTLELGAESSLYRETYGNIHVEEGGKLILGSGTLNVNNLYLDASLGNSSTRANSGQIRNVEQIDVNGDAYFDLRLDPVKCSYGWYDFTVPFPVDNRTGISRFQNGAWNTSLRTEQHYAIMTYYEDIRANGQYGWKKYYGIMQPGKCYTITVDNTAPLYRFRKVNGADFNTSNMVALTATDGTGGVVNKGWNCIGNGTLTHTLISSAENYKVQIYDHANNSYGVLDDHANYEFPVGTAVFVQTNVSTNLVFTDVNASVAEAPMRTQGRTLEEYLLTFGRENDANNQDRLYLSASEDAENSYEIGHDLAKFGTSTTVAQIWADAYGQKLCDVEAPLVDDQAIIPISLYAAQTGTYTLETVRGPQDASLYLMYEGAVVWNLSQSAYTLDLTRGTTTGYSLLLTAEAPSITTGADAIEVETNHVEKIILNGKLYILRDGEMYDATGKKVK